MLAANATMVFTDYQIKDEGLELHFVCPNPGAGEASDYYVLATDAELSVITKVSEFKTLIVNKLQRKLRAANLASKLDPYVGQSVVI